jgi:long-chain acyl-CoA synthetase
MNTKPWLKYYDKGVPHTLRPYPGCTLLDIVSDTVRQKPEHPAMLFKGASISYSELDRFSNALGTALVNVGIRKGDRVALLLPNSPQSIIAEFGGSWRNCRRHEPCTQNTSKLALNECGVKPSLS